MKKFNRRIHKTMGSLPPQLFKYFDMADIKSATDEFNACITSIANEFHSKLEYFFCQILKVFKEAISVKF